MDVNFEQKVREKAYEIWMSAGMADGMAHEHWVTAEKVINETEMPVKKAKAVPGKMVAAKAASATAKKPAAKPAAPKAAAAKKAPAKAPKAAKTVKH